MQDAVTDRASEQPDDKRIMFRVGVNLGDVVIDDTAMMPGDRRIDSPVQHRPQRGERAFLIRPDQAGIAGNVGGQYRGDASFHGDGFTT